MGKTKKIEVKGTEITIVNENSVDYISLTDMIRNRKNFDIGDWIRNKKTVEFLGVWESINNKDFNVGKFADFKNNALTKKVSMRQWINETNAIGLISKSGRYGGTYAHKDIAYHFGMWLSPEFQLLIIKEFDRLKREEAERNEIGWDYQRFLSKANYKLHTDSIKENILPSLNIPYGFEGGIYAHEAEILNYAVFGITAKEWRRKFKNKVKKGDNVRNHADLYELNVLSNLEVLNSKLIRQGTSSDDRLIILEEEASFQLKSLRNNSVYSKQQIQSPNKKLA